MNRREFFIKAGTILPALFVFNGCKGGFTREPGVFDLGEVSALLFNQVLARDVQFLVVRDEQGWGAMSTRCTYYGCDLTYQESILFCSCCRSVFAHDGRVLRGPAREPLPWVQVSYSSNHLYADAGKPVSPAARFTTEEIEAKIKELGLKIRDFDEIAPAETEVPEVLRGGDTQGPIMIDQDSLP